jgi:hypothetical protein
MCSNLKLPFWQIFCPICLRRLFYIYLRPPLEGVEIKGKLWHLIATIHLEGDGVIFY